VAARAGRRELHRARAALFHSVASSARRSGARGVTGDNTHNMIKPVQKGVARAPAPGFSPREKQWESPTTKGVL